MSNKIHPYNPRSRAYEDSNDVSEGNNSVGKSPRRPPLSRGNSVNNSGGLEDFFDSDNNNAQSNRNSFTEQNDNSTSSVTEQRSQLGRRHKDSIDFTQQKKTSSKAHRSPRSRGNSSGGDESSRPNSGASNKGNSTPRSRANNGGANNDDSFGIASPPLSRANSRKVVNKKSTRKKGVTFRVPLEDRYGFDSSTYNDSLSGGGTDHSLNEEDFKNLTAAKGGAKDGDPSALSTVGKTKAEIRRMNRKRNRKHKKGVLPAIARQCASVTCVIC